MYRDGTASRFKYLTSLPEHLALTSELSKDGKCLSLHTELDLEPFYRGYDDRTNYELSALIAQSCSKKTNVYIALIKRSSFEWVTFDAGQVRVFNSISSI